MLYLWYTKTLSVIYLIPFWPPLYQRLMEGSPKLWPRYFSESTLSHPCSNTCCGSPLSNHQLVIWDPLLSDLQWFSQPHLPALNTPRSFLPQGLCIAVILFFKMFLMFLLNFLQYCFCFLCFGFCPWCMCDLSSLTKDQTHTFCIWRRSLNHWTTREVPCCYLCLEDSPLT